ncbi:MAG TPA: histidine kinase, partial [Conexibacter sp.]|nr:histidine kinase [Conexibacter sp.]
MAADEQQRERAGARRLDLLLAGWLLAIGQLELLLTEPKGDALAARLLWAVAAVAVTTRRAHPLLFFAWAVAVQAASAGWDLRPESFSALGWLYPTLALFGLGAYVGDPRRARAAAAGGLLLMFATRAALDAAGWLHHPTLDAWLGELSLFLPAAAGGILLRDRTEALTAARARARAAAVDDGAAAVALALTEERTRIARELHAVVTGCVRTVLDELEALRSPLTVAPQAVLGALRRARAASQRALAEMRRMLDLLRAEPEVAALAGAGLAAPPAAQRAGSLLRGALLPLFVLAIGLLETLAASGRPVGFYGSATAAERLVGTIALALAFVPYRRWPLASVAAALAVVLLRYGVSDDLIGLDLPTCLAAFVAGGYVRRPALAVAGGVAATASGIAANALMLGWAGAFDPLAAALFGVTMTTAAWGTGFAVRRRIAEAAELRALTAAEEARRARQVELALTAERLGVARELHDLVGHGLGSIALQTAAAERLLPLRPDDAATAIAAVDAAARDTLAELEQLLAALGDRHADGDDRRHGDAVGGGRAVGGGAVRGHGAPSLAQLPQLLHGARRGGLTIVCELRGTVAVVPPGQSAAAYRIVQEALTNARKHGDAAREVRLRILCAPGGVELEVRNALPPAPCDM